MFYLYPYIDKIIPLFRESPQKNAEIIELLGVPKSDFPP